MQSPIVTTLNQLAEFGPEIVVIDSNLLDEEVDALVVAIKAKHPLVSCLVLTSSGSREARVRAHGADTVVARDASGQDLREKLLKLARVSID